MLGAPPIGEEALVADVTLLLEGRPFSLTVFVVGAPAPVMETRLEELGELTLRLPLVVGSVALDRQELLALEPGGALLLGAGASIDVATEGYGVLVGPHSERGIRVDLRPDGRLVVRDTTEARLTVEPNTPSQNEGETLTDVLLETPVVVRVELGAVSMSAREWAQLGPGDVVVDTFKSMAVYEEWLRRARGAEKHSPDGTRRPYWLLRPLKPGREVYRLRE